MTATGCKLKNEWHLTFWVEIFSLQDGFSFECSTACCNSALKRSGRLRERRRGSFMTNEFARQLVVARKRARAKANQDLSSGAAPPSCAETQGARCVLESALTFRISEKQPGPWERKAPREVQTAEESARSAKHLQLAHLGIAGRRFIAQQLAARVGSGMVLMIPAPNDAQGAGQSQTPKQGHRLCLRQRPIPRSRSGTFPLHPQRRDHRGRCQRLFERHARNQEAHGRPRARQLCRGYPWNGGRNVVA
jgi:hypothetical protein